MIKYVIQAKRNPANPEQTKYYPQMAPSTPITLAQVVKRIEKRSTVSSADVKAVLDALQYEVVEALADGNSIRLNDLGSFRLTITANGVDSAAEAKKQGARLIKQENGSITTLWRKRRRSHPPQPRLGWMFWRACSSSCACSPILTMP